MPAVLPSGERAALVSCADAVSARWWSGALRRTPPPGTRDLVPAETTVLVVLDAVADRAGPVDRVRAHLDLLATGGTAGASAAHLDSAEGEHLAPITLTVDYSGPDLEDLARRLDRTPEQLIRAHTDERWEVAFGGFAPGFGYLVPTRGVWGWDIARHDSPRPRVPAGAVGVAGRYAGVYPTASPGGWMLLGTTDATLFDPDRDPAALLRPGVRVRFVDGGGRGGS